MPVSNAQRVPINIAGSSIFGRFPKISLEKTYNMFVSDNWIINYAGFKKVIDFLPKGEGRGIFKSVRGGFILSVVESAVYRLNSNFIPILIGNIETNTGEVFIDENLNSQICLVDGEKAYIYNYSNSTFTTQISLKDKFNVTIIPGYVSYQNTFFLIASAATNLNPQNWYVFETDTPQTIKINSQFSLQTKPDSALAVKRMPGRGNNAIVFGSSVCEIWTQVGGVENYRRIQSFNIDYGTISISTIAGSDEFICWIAQNESNLPVLMVTDGSSIQRISDDGIDHLFSTIQFPEESTAFFFRQDGHLFYQFTFFNPKDNLTLVYDFTIKKFYHLSDEKLNFHPARKVVLFNDETYFLSLNDAGIYKMNNTLNTYDYSTDPLSIGEEIPRIRICKSIRKDDSSIFRVGFLTFWIEQGVNKFFLDNPLEQDGLILTQEGNGFVLTQEGGFILQQDALPLPTALSLNAPRVDMSFSKNGNQSFSNIVSRQLNPAGQYRNQLRYWRMGHANEFTPQFRFWGFQRFVAYDGIAEVY